MPALIVSLALVYYPVFTTDFARLDDFNIFANVYFGRFHPWTSWLAIQGRPLASFFTWLLYSPMESLSGLQWIRGIGFLGALLLAVSLDAALRRFKRTPLERYLTVLIICCIPGIAVFTGWAICYTFSWGAAIAVWGGIQLAPWPDRPHLRPRQWIMGPLAIFISLWFYQPSALFGLLPLLMAGLLMNERPGQMLRRLGISGGLFVGALGAYYIAYKKVFLALMPPLDEGLQSRLEHARDYGAQVRVIVDRALPESFEGWAYFFDDGLAGAMMPAVITVLLLGGLVAAWRAGWQTATIKGAGILGCIVLSLIPILYLSTGIPYFRMMGPFSAIVIVLLAASIRVLFTGRVAFLGSAVLLCLAVLQGSAAFLMMRQYWVRPAEQELRLYREYAARHFKEPAEGLLVTASRRWLHGGDKRRYQFGFLSTNQLWIMDPLARLLYAELHGREAARDIPVLSASGSEEVPFLTSLDANRILWGESISPQEETPTVHGFGRLVQLKMDGLTWWGSEWFGPFQVLDKDKKRLRHLILGEMEFGWDGEELHLKTARYSWVHTNRKKFPLAIRSSDGALVHLGSSAGR